MKTGMPGNPSRSTPGDRPAERIGHETGGTTLVLVADGAVAHLFERLPDGRVTPKPEFSRNALAVREHEAGGDRPGRTFPAAGSTNRSGMEPRTDPDKRAEGEFLAGVLEALGAMLARGEFRHLYLFAPPVALGQIRKAMPKALGAVVLAEGNLDLTRHGPDDIARHVLDLEREKQTP